MSEEAVGEEIREKREEGRGTRDEGRGTREERREKKRERKEGEERDTSTTRDPDKDPPAVGEQTALDHALRRDPGMVKTRNPTHVVATHPPPTSEAVLQGHRQRMAYM